MNERYSPRNIEISRQEKEALINRMRDVAPYTGQTLDFVGCYATHFYQGDVMVSLYIPGLPEVGDEDDVLDDGVRLIRRESLGVEGGHELVKVESYVIYLSTYDAEYSEDIKLYDAKTGEYKSPFKGMNTDLNDEETRRTFSEIYDLQKSQSDSNVFNATRLQEATDILDSLS